MLKSPDNKMTHLEVEVEVHETSLQKVHIDDKDQENVTAIENEPTHSDIVATKSLEKHETLFQEVHLQQDQFVKLSTEIDTNIDVDEVEAMEETRSWAVAMFPLEVNEKQTVLREELIETQMKVTVTDAQQQQENDNIVPGTTMGEKHGTKEDSHSKGTESTKENRNTRNVIA